MMKMLNISMRASTASALAAFLPLIAFTAFAKTPEPPGPFSPQSIASGTALPQRAIAGKSTAVKINYGQLRSGRFFIRLPGGVSFQAVRTMQQDLDKGRFAWVGVASDDRNSSVVIGVSGDAVSGTFSYHGKLYKLEPRANGSHVLSEVKSTDPAPELDPIPVADTTTNSTGSASVIAAADSNGSVQDVLVAYTPAVQALYGAAGADALIIRAVAEANQAYINSKMTTRLNLVRSVLTNYIESGSMSTDLSRLSATGDGYMDELHSLRNTYGADLVSLIENEPQYCGIGYLLNSLSSSWAPWAFSVVHHDCATGYYSFAHEIGHNQGANHDLANSSDPNLYPYAHGYQDPLNRFRTIMAYDCPAGCPRIQRFSRGDNPLNGVPTGDAAYAGNAVVIDQTAAIVAAFRQSVTQAPSAPTGLGATASSASQITLTWTDTSATESGFLVERSTDNLSFTQIASLPANSKSYSDSNLANSMSYYYRVRAWNSVGNSGYSNVVTATTQAAPQYVDQLASGEFSNGGKVSGIFNDTWGDDGAFESIAEVVSAGSKDQRYSYLEHYWSFTVQPGQSVTLYADVSTTAIQSFTFAYSTSSASGAANEAGWIDMFSVSSSNSGARQFTLPASLSGPVYISVRDDSRVAGISTSNSVNIDYLAIRTDWPTEGTGTPPGC